MEAMIASDIRRQKGGRCHVRSGSFTTFAWCWHVRFASNSDRIADMPECPVGANCVILDQNKAPLIEHLVGDGEHPFRNCHMQRFRSLQVDDQFELIRL
jgi:hypothetical protein